MKFDFSVPMTFYEFLAIILAAVAIIIPIGQAIWRKWVLKGKINFLPTGRVKLFFNQSGSYIRIDGVFESIHKPVSLKKTSVKVTRHKDDCKLNLAWSSFISPVNQTVIGNYMQTTEAAHPFQIAADSIACAFIEYSDEFDSFGKKFRADTATLFSKINDIRNECADYLLAIERYKNTSEYSAAKTMLSKEFFWEIGKYSVDIGVIYGKKSKHFHYTISIGEYEHRLLIDNIDEALLSPLKSAYGVGWDYHTVNVELQEQI